MQKKIGLITLYRDNFGSILQAYSTYSYIQALKCDCRLLEEAPQSFCKKIKRIPVILHRSIVYNDYLKERRKNKKVWKEELNLLSKETKEKMDSFIESIFEIEQCNSKKINLLNSEYDYFVTGSDQVWNGFDAFRYLTFADEGKKVALAPSFGSGNVKDYFRKDIKKAIDGFKELSVREESGLKIIKELTGKDAIRLPDPTLLLTKQEWELFAAKGLKKKNYILLHFLNKPNELAIKIINEYLRIYDYATYCICNRYDEYKQLVSFEFLDISPYDYVSLISNANFVFTDSFHSTLFSLNLETQFLTFERQYLHGSSQSSRIVDLLERMNMPDRFLLKDNGTINFGQLEQWNSNLIFEEERKLIVNYIRKRLGEIK